MFPSLVLALTAAASPSVQPALQPLAPLVGHCWRGDAPGGAGIDTHCFEAVYGGAHIRDRHTVDVGGKTVYAGEAVYSVEKGKIAFTYWNSLGGVGHASAEATPTAVNFVGEMREDPSSELQPMHATWRTLAEGYEVVWPDGTPHIMKRVP
jgi:hypothetical protein